MNETAQGRGFVQRYDIVLGGGPFEVVAADVNNDSVADLVVANADLNTIDVVLGRTAGGFETPQHIAAAGFPRGVAVADLDWDGRPDIVYTQFDLDRVQILHGDGAGQFTARVAAMPTGPRPQGVVIGDFVGCCRPRHRRVEHDDPRPVALPPGRRRRRSSDRTWSRHPP